MLEMQISNIIASRHQVARVIRMGNDELVELMAVNTFAIAMAVSSKERLKRNYDAFFNQYEYLKTLLKKPMTRQYLEHAWALWKNTFQDSMT